MFNELCNKPWDELTEDEKRKLDILFKAQEKESNEYEIYKIKKGEYDY